MSDIIIASKREAEDRAERIRTALSVSWDLIKDAWKAFDWQALGYPSWDAYCDGEFGTSRIRLPREERREVVSSMREIGMSTRAISAATGADRNTVRSDLRQVDEIHPPEPGPVTGTDGKTYTQPERPRATAMPQADLDALNTPPAPSPAEPADPEDDEQMPEWENVAQLPQQEVKRIQSETEDRKITVPDEDETEKERLIDLMGHLRKATREVKEVLYIAQRLDTWDAEPITGELRDLLDSIDTTLTTGGLDAELARLTEGNQS